MKANTIPDQTQFINESGFYEANIQEEPIEVNPEQETQQQQKKQRLIILSVFGFLFIILLIFIVVQAKSRQEKGSNVDSEETEVSEAVLDPFNQRVSELRQDLEAADPSQEDLPFPLIDLEISLEE